jgi:hypothetical protein
MLPLFDPELFVAQQCVRSAHQQADGAGIGGETIPFIVALFYKIGRIITTCRVLLVRLE